MRRIIETDPEQKQAFERILSQLETSKQAMLTRYGSSIRLDLMRPRLQRELRTRLISVTVEFLDKKLRQTAPMRCIAHGYGKKTAGWITSDHPDKRLVATYLNNVAVPITYGWEQREGGVGGNTLQRITANGTTGRIATRKTPRKLK